jgi:signal transduction histidine kinase
MHLNSKEPIQLYSVLAHDLRTPLSAIKNYAELISFVPEQKSTSPALAKRIVTLVNRMDSMIANLLDTNRIQAGENFSFVLEPCELDQLITSTCDELSILYGNCFVTQLQKGIQGKWSKDGIRRCLENLCSNAFKYGDPGAPITIHLSRSENWIEISVHNFGAPIPPDELPHLFQAYYRSTMAIQQRKGGWGIGLTLVRGLVEAMGGSVHVQSSERKGTTFTLFLPLECTSN